MKDIVLPLGIAFLSILGNYYYLPIFPDVDFVFGGIFTLLLLQVYGWRWALPATLVAGLYTLLLWGHPFGFILFILEIVFIALWQQKRRENDLLTAVAAYWFLVVPGLIVLFYLHFLQLDSTEALLIYLKLALNGIFNAMIVSLVLSLYRRKRGNSVSNLISLLVVAVVMVPAMVHIFARVFLNFSASDLVREEAVDYFIADISTTLFFLGLAILGAKILSRNLSAPLQALGNLTTELAANPNELIGLDWPKTSVEEIGQVTENVKELVNTCNEHIEGLERAREQYEYLANHDPLTTLPNRTYFEECLAAEINAGGNKPIWLYFIDPDSLKRINDSFGHAAGDSVLIQVSRRIEKVLNMRGTMGRYGNSFVIYVPDLNSNGEALALAQEILTSLKEPFAVVNQLITVNNSIGICSYPNDGKDVSSLLKNADLAMHEAKAAGNNQIQMFDKEMAYRVARRLYLENRLPKALEQGEIFLHYQPQVNAYSGEIYGVEALARWKHPELGMISPLEFITYAEESGFIVELGQWILKEACRQAVEWAHAGFDQFVVSVNVSQGQINDFSFIDMVAKTLADVGLDPERLQLEITESLIMDNPLAAGEVCRQLRGMGVKLAMDDFGTGYSSLEYLRLLPWNTLKLDRTFVQNIDNQIDEIITKTIVELAHDLGLKVIAEGVENTIQLAGLQASGCRLIQGYLFAQPMDATELTSYLKEHTPVDSSLQIV